MTSPRRWFLPVSLIAATLPCLLFLLGLHGGFLFDDEPNIINNPAIQMDRLDGNGLYNVVFGLQPGGITRVIPTVSFALDYWRGNGLHPEIFKATNVAIHALTAFVLAWFFRALLRAVSLPEKRASITALALTLAWAIHPLQVSSVLYVVQRMQTLCTLFVVMGLLAYLLGRQAQIEGRSGRIGWLLAIMCWILAAGCKEDAILLPAYTLAMEFTILRFNAASPILANRLRKGYLLATLIGAAGFVLVVVPHYWTWNPYPGRDFNTYERLLTQGRVLVMYLWEILLPLPSHMPFYYDWVQPSRGLLHPWTTLPAILLLVALLTVAWRLRTRRPLFALGVFLFFAGHFITSNVAGLELAFEHRNQFPLIGIILAAGDLIWLAGQSLRLRPEKMIAVGALLVIVLSSTTIARARIWDSPLTLARGSTESAPHSARAWNSLCLYYYELGGGKDPKNPYLDKAIDICSQGSAAAPYSITSLNNLIIFKTRRGMDTQADWTNLQDRLRHVTLGPENIGIISVLMNNVSNGVPLDETGVLSSIDIFSNRAPLGPNEYAAIGNFILTETHQPERAYPYFEHSIRLFGQSGIPSDSITKGLREHGRTDWANKLEVLARGFQKPQDRH